jgi:hypothetical protein
VVALVRGRWNVPQSTELRKTEPADELMPPSGETQPSCRAVNAKFDWNARLRTGVERRG